MVNADIKNNLITFYTALKERNEPAENYEQEIMNYLERKARRKAVPLYGHFELTPMCNLDCKMCYVHLNKSQFHSNQLLTVDTWKKLIDQAHSAGMIRASLTGGECLTYPGFYEVYLHLYSIGIVPSVLSNGVLLDDEHIEFFKKYPPKRIKTTLYGSSNEAYERVTGKRFFDKVYQNLIKTQKAGLPINICITPNAYMKDDMRSLIEVVESLEIPYSINAALISPRKETKRAKADLTDDEYIEFYRIRNEILHIPTEKIDGTEIPDENHTENIELGLRCGGGRSSFAITYDGSMCPCFSLNHIKAQPLEVGFQSAWQQINNSAVTYPIPAECRDCVYRDVCMTCPGMHLHAPVLGHCDPRICERTKKMIRAGVISIAT